jgi:lysophospholipase L1-like esterase
MFTTLIADVSQCNAIVFRNSNGVGIDTYGNGADKVEYNNVIIPSIPNGAYDFVVTCKHISQTPLALKVRSRKNNTTMVNTAVKSLQYTTLRGKKILCLGESTTEFTNDKGKGWPAYAADYTEGTFIVGAVGGTRLSQRATPADVPSTISNSYASLDMCNLVESWVANDWTRVDAAVEWIKNNASDDNTAIIQNLKNNPITDIDMIVILGGGNDMLQNAPLGTVSDKNKTSILGAVNYILDAILTANPKVKIYWASLMARYYGTTWTTEYWSDNRVLPAYEKTTPQVIEDMAAVVKAYHIQWCDLYWTLWNEYNAKSYYTKYYGDGNSSNDSSHPWGGFDVMGRKIGSFLMANQLQP